MGSVHLQLRVGGGAFQLTPETAEQLQLNIRQLESYLVADERRREEGGGCFSDKTVDTNFLECVACLHV